MRHQKEYDLVGGLLLLFLRKEILKNWNRAQQRRTAIGLGLGSFHNTAEQVDFPMEQTIRVIDLVLADDRLADSDSRIRVAGLDRQFQRGLQANLPVGMDMGRDFKNYAGIEISELGIYAQAGAARNPQGCTE